MPSEQRNPSAFAPMHFGTPLRGLRTTCERFACRVAPTTRITRFQLAADLGCVGLVTHRVSNKVSGITSCHLILLDRALPGTRVGAWIQLTADRSRKRLDSHPNRVRGRHSKFGHVVEDVAREPNLNVLRIPITRLLVVARTFFHWRRPTLRMRRTARSLA